MSASSALAAEVEGSTRSVARLELPAGVAVEAFGLLHVDLVPWDRAATDELDPISRTPLNDERFVVRRARVGARLAYQVLSARIEIDASTQTGRPSVRVLSAELGASLPGALSRLLVVRAGLLKIPFGWAIAERVPQRLFMETPIYVRAMLPGEYDLGVVLSGKYDVFDYSLGLLNGNPLGESSVGGLDLTSSKDLAGRLGVALLRRSWVCASVGASVLFGEALSPGAAATKDAVSWRDLNKNAVVELNELEGRVGTPASPSRSFGRLAIGGDLGIGFELGERAGIDLTGELVWGHNLDRGLYLADPIAAGRDAREIGWWVSARLRVAGVGAAAVRFDRYEAEGRAAGAGTRLDASVSAISAVVEWQPMRYLALALAYDHREVRERFAGESATSTPPDDAMTVRASVEVD